MRSMAGSREVSIFLNFGSRLPRWSRDTHGTDTRITQTNLTTHKYQTDWDSPIKCGYAYSEIIIDNVGIIWVNYMDASTSAT